jgi:sarcosine oxidase subunit beta
VTLREIERLQVEDLLGFAPAHYQKAYYCPIDCWVNPLRLNMVLIRALEKLGGRHACGVEFQKLETDNGRVAAVCTNIGRVVAPRVIMASGTALPHMLKPFGVDFPVRPNRGHVLVTQPLPYKILPHVVHVSRNGNFIVLVQTDRGHLLIGVTHEVGVDTREINLPLALDLARRAAAVYPFLKDVQLLRIWAGVRPWPDDVLPIVEDFEQPQGLMAVTSHSGVTLCAKLSRMAADLVLGGPMAEEAAEYGLKRFQKKVGHV